MYQSERRSKRRTAKRPTAPQGVIHTGPGVFGIGSYRPAQPMPLDDLVQHFGPGDVRTGMQEHGARSPARGWVPGTNAGAPSSKSGGGGGGGKGFGFSDSDLMAQALAEAAAQYDPQIAALNSAMAQAKSQTAYNKSGIDQLYDQLAATYAGDIKESKQSFKEAKSSEKKLSQTTRKEIAGSYNTAEADLAKQMQALGIEAAAPDVLPGLTKDEANALAGEAERTAVEQSAYGRQGTAEESYYQRGPSLARMGSAEGQSALTEQLNQFLLDQQGQKAMLGSQKSLTYNALLGKYRQQAAQQAYQQQQDQFAQQNTIFDNELALKKFQEGQRQFGIRQQGQAQAPQQFKGYGGAQQLLTQYKGGDVQGAGKLYQDLNAAVSAASQKGINTSDYPAMLQYLREFAQKMGIASNDIGALQQALAAAMGKY